MASFFSTATSTAAARFPSQPPLFLFFPSFSLSSVLLFFPFLAALMTHFLQVPSNSEKKTINFQIAEYLILFD